MKLNWDSWTTRWFCVLCVVACVGIVFALVAGIAAGGYRPERYGGGFDPVRAGMLVAAGSGVAAFGLVTGAMLAIRLSGRETIPWPRLLFVGGLELEFLTILALFAWMPATSEPQSVPLVLRPGLFLGLAMIGVGFFDDLATGVRQAIREGRSRDLLVVGLVLFVAIALTVVMRAGR